MCLSGACAPATTAKWATITTPQHKIYVRDLANSLSYTSPRPNQPLYNKAQRGDSSEPPPQGFAQNMTGGDNQVQDALVGLTNEIAPQVRDLAKWANEAWWVPPSSEAGQVWGVTISQWKQSIVYGQASVLGEAHHFFGNSAIKHIASYITRHTQTHQTAPHFGLPMGISAKGPSAFVAYVNTITTSQQFEELVSGAEMHAKHNAISREQRGQGVRPPSGRVDISNATNYSILFKIRGAMRYIVQWTSVYSYIAEVIAVEQAWTRAGGQAPNRHERLVRQTDRANWTPYGGPSSSGQNNGISG